MIVLLSVLLVVLSPVAGFAQNSASGYIQVTVEYTSMFPGKLQVRDMVCRDRRSAECAKADITLQSEVCRQQPAAAACTEAMTLLDTSFCIAGLVLESRVSQGEKVQARLCRSASGFGTLSVRDVEKGETWTTHVLLNDGASVSYP